MPAITVAATEPRGRAVRLRRARLIAVRASQSAVAAASKE